MSESRLAENLDHVISELKAVRSMCEVDGRGTCTPPEYDDAIAVLERERECRRGNFPEEVMSQLHRMRSERNHYRERVRQLEANLTVQADEIVPDDVLDKLGRALAKAIPRPWARERTRLDRAGEVWGIFEMLEDDPPFATTTLWGDSEANATAITMMANCIDDMILELRKHRVRARGLAQWLRAKLAAYEDEVRYDSGRLPSEALEIGSWVRDLADELEKGKGPQE